MLLGLASIALAAFAPIGPGVPPIQTSICAPQVVGYDASAGRAVLDSALIETLGPSQLLRSLGALTPLELRQFVEDDESALRELIAAPPSPQEIELWWSTLDSSEQNALEHEAPELLGNLDGVPYDVRDRANRDELADAQQEIRDRLSAGIGKGEAALAVSRLKMLQRIEDSLQPTADGPRRSLLMLDTVMPGRAAVALGDLDSADYVSLLVPGALLSVREHMTEWTKVTDDLYREQADWLQRFGEDSTVATVSWIGYRTPDVTNVAGMELAEEGASFLSGTVNGLHILRDRDEPYVSVFAHSYGATAAMLALDRGDMTVDALAMMGSPGGPAARADDLHVPSGHVWVGEAAWDPVVHTAFFGADPGSSQFGAKPMNVSGSVDPVTGAVLTASVGHDWYLEPGTESLRNLSLIGIDRGDWVTDGSADDSGKTLALAR